MRKILLFACLSIAAFTYSCKEKQVKQEAEQKQVSKDSLKAQIDMLADSVTFAWDTLTRSDDQKFADIKRLLEEISYTGQYDVTGQKALMEELPKVKENRYTQENLTVEAIERYDSITDSYVARVFDFAGKNKELKNHPLAEELIQDINYTNTEGLIRLRVNYDRWAYAFNTFIKNNKDYLEQLGEPYKSYKEKKTFSGVNS